MEGEEGELFASTVRSQVASRAGGALDDLLDPLGWTDAYAEDPQLAVSVLFEQQGAVNASSRALLHVFGSAVLPIPGSAVAPGAVTGSGLVVRGVGLSGAMGAETVDLVAMKDGAHRLLTVPTEVLVCEPLAGIDPALGLVAVSSASPLHPGGGPETDWTGSVAAARLALAHELVGISHTMLRLARDHAVDRVQGGRAIASYQAVRHRLADGYVAVQAASSATVAAWELPSPLASTVAKLLAGRAARVVARNAQQVLAGMGFSQEHAFHHHLRRALVLDELFGSARGLAAELGAEALRTGILPDLLPL